MGLKERLAIQGRRYRQLSGAVIVKPYRRLRGEIRLYSREPSSSLSLFICSSGLIWPLSLSLSISISRTHYLYLFVTRLSFPSSPGRLQIPLIGGFPANINYHSILGHTTFLNNAIMQIAGVAHDVYFARRDVLCITFIAGDFSLA